MTPFRLFWYIVAVGGGLGAVVVLIFLFMCLVALLFFALDKAFGIREKKAAKVADQSGNGRDLVQPVVSKRPHVVVVRRQRPDIELEDDDEPDEPPPPRAS